MKKIDFIEKNKYLLAGLGLAILTVGTCRADDDENIKVAVYNNYGFKITLEDLHLCKLS